MSDLVYQNYNNRCKGWVNPSNLNFGPIIYNLSGYYSPAGSTTLVSINGDNFFSYSSISFGTFKPTVYFINSNILQFYVPSTLNSGIFPVQVFNGSIYSNSVNYTIDQNRIYSCGFSAGGFMSHMLACKSSRCFAAIASVAGTMTDSVYNSCAPIFNLPVLQIHGTSDNIVNFNGSLGNKSATDVVDYWKNFNGCNAAPIITSLPNTSLLDFSTVQLLDYSPCSNNDLPCISIKSILTSGTPVPFILTLIDLIPNNCVSS